MLLKTYEKIKGFNTQQLAKQFSMPLSLRYMKELGNAGIDWKGLHLIDITSLIYSLRIDIAKQKLEMDKQKAMNERGIQAVRPATQEDFDWL